MIAQRMKNCRYWLKMMQVNVIILFLYNSASTHLNWVESIFPCRIVVHMKVHINTQLMHRFEILIVNHQNSGCVKTLILLLSTPERPPNPILKSASLCSYKECYSHSQQNHAVAKISADPHDTSTRTHA